ncbi:MAG: hypothetical protein IPM66_09350 [Acidobacteriota bacterium]|nr:MAG: hypothetical protein IPM66_09350 [Acidobacteriota bacterium]
MVSITTSVNTLLQTLVRDRMRGRVMSMHGLSFLGFPGEPARQNFPFTMCHLSFAIFKERVSGDGK